MQTLAKKGGEGGLDRPFLAGMIGEPTGALFRGICHLVE